MKTKFVCIKYHGLFNVAVLEEDGRQFNLDADDLKFRIENMKKDGRDTSNENLALAELNRLENIDVNNYHEESNLIIVCPNHHRIFECVRKRSSKNIYLDLILPHKIGCVVLDAIKINSHDNKTIFKAQNSE